MIKITSKGDFSKTFKFLSRAKERKYLRILEHYAKEGVAALSSATPVRTGATAASWGYELKIKNDEATITWLNTNVNDGQNIAVLIQYGHGTGFGGYVKGIDYINPAMKPIFDSIANEAWREVTAVT